MAHFKDKMEVLQQSVGNPPPQDTTVNPRSHSDDTAESGNLPPPPPPPLQPFQQLLLFIHFICSLLKNDTRNFPDRATLLTCPKQKRWIHFRINHLFENIQFAQLDLHSCHRMSSWCQKKKKSKLPSCGPQWNKDTLRCIIKYNARVLLTLDNLTKGWLRQQCVGFAHMPSRVVSYNAADFSSL